MAGEEDPATRGRPGLDEQGKADVPASISMKELAKGIGVYTDRVDTGPDLWAIVLSLAIVTFGVALGAWQAGMVIDMSVMLFTMAVILLMVALFLRK